MDEDQTIVMLDLGHALHTARPRFKIPSADILFKQIQYEAQAKKQLRQKQNQSNVYEKIKKALQRKLGTGRYMRGISAKQEMKAKQMIQTCNQRKHIRARNLSDRDFGSQNSRYRNYSAKQSYRSTCRTSSNQYSRPQTSRPKTSKPLTSRPQTSKLCSEAESRQMSQICQTNQYDTKNQTNHANKKVKKKSNTKPFLKMQFDKENINPMVQFKEKTVSTNLIYQQLQIGPEIEQFNSTADGRKRKNKLILKNRFKNIIQNCDNEKEEITCLGKKIGHFEYFCKRMTDKKSHIQKFCKKMEAKNIMLDQSFS